MTAYLEVTADIPWVWISHGLHELVRRPKPFAPSVGEIRQSAALAARKHYGQGTGGGYNPAGEYEIDADRWLAIAREMEQQPRQLPERTRP
jgi:hypothetical protein